MVVELKSGFRNRHNAQTVFSNKGPNPQVNEAGDTFMPDPNGSHHNQLSADKLARSRLRGIEQRACRRT